MSLSSRLARFRPRLLRTARTISGLLAFAVLATFGTIGYNVAAAYYWLMAGALVPGALYGVLRRAVPLADARVRARHRWKAYGPTVDRVPYDAFEELRARYGERTRDPDLGHVDDRTWNDLGMDAIHDRIDVCFTMAGRNELYRILRHALPPESTLGERAQLMALFTDDEAERERVAQELARVGEERNADPAAILWGDTVRRDNLFPLFVGMSAFSIVSLLVAIFANVALGLIAGFAAFAANMWLYYRKARHLSLDIPALRVLSRMIDAARGLDWYGLPGLNRRTNGVKRAFRWLLTGAPSPSPTFSGDMTEMLLLYIKIFFQIDLIAYNRIVSYVDRNRDAFRALYQGIGSIDALYALASYRARRKRTCTAEAGAGATVYLDGAYHPLVAKAIPNSIDLAMPGAIVTGTNMAGKSTFLRMVGVNVLFAQTAGYAFAKEYRAPRFRLMSSIEKRDDLAEGKSFYYDEAERIYTMIEEVGAETPALLLIDELLSGTNSLERESASIAILHYLADRNALTVAATHDVTIARGVADRYALHYFTDSADESGLSFDYKIHDGVVQTRNAIKLLRLIGYPEDVIESALERTHGV
ncbi:MAG: MutS-related protein [Spirochaetota bacterium]